MAIPLFGPPRDATRQAELVLDEFLTMSAEQYFGREIFETYLQNVSTMTWSEAARELGTIIDAPVDRRAALAVIAQRIAAARVEATQLGSTGD